MKNENEGRPEVSPEELERLYAIEAKVREILDASAAYVSSWEFKDCWDMSADGMSYRDDLEQLLDQGDGYAVQGRLPAGVS